MVVLYWHDHWFLHLHHRSLLRGEITSTEAQEIWSQEAEDQVGQSTVAPPQTEQDQDVEVQEVEVQEVQGGPGYLMILLQCLTLLWAWLSVLPQAGQVPPLVLPCPHLRRNSLLHLRCLSPV